MCDSECSCYADAEKETPPDSSEPKGKSAIMTLHFDADLCHNLISGEAVTGVLHLFDQTPVDWFSKLQSTVETAVFRSEHVTTRTCTKHVIDLRLTLRCLGVPMNGKTMVFGDNELAVNSVAIPHLKMHKRWVTLSYDQVRWAVTVGIINIHHVPSKENSADWDLPSVWEMVKPLLFWHEKDDQKSQEESK